MGRSAAAPKQRLAPCIVSSRRQRRVRQPGPSAAIILSSDEAADGSGGATTQPMAAAGLLQRVLTSCCLADRSTLVLAAVLGGALLLGSVEPALASGDASGPPQLLGDLAENEDFWGNVVSYISYFFSVLLGTAYIAVKPIIELMKKPGTAVLVVAGTASLIWFVSFTVQAMLGMNDTLDFTASSIVTPFN
ncbi:hypothetical protein D9Q98_001815 [Chlorella vulgaris]|uniref:Uncharacterized protein ycf33 n=1 Tax=Chlorella vulgaris TaxID=3077 RepID=A0A9D4TWG1_CHLVU|nr:hypothetical protein D9Q98_001815 [Chlorella vulgaris]